MNALIFIAVGLAFIAFTGLHVGVAVMALDSLDESESARFGIDNSPPPSLQKRVDALGKCAETISAMGLRVRSAYRCKALTEAMFSVQAASTSDHSEAKALDVAPRKPTTDMDELKRAQSQLLSSKLGHFIERAVIETDHIHVVFSTSYLDGG